MKITKINYKTVPIASKIKNAFIDFSSMTISIVAVHTDYKLNGKPVIGFGFNSNGRYGQEGILKERIIPRLLKARGKEIINKDTGIIDPFKCLDIMMTNEKPGGHGERSVAIGTIDMAIWDIVAKVENLPLYKFLGERYNEGKYSSKVYTYAAGGYYYSGKNIQKLQDELKKYIDMGFSACKIKVGGASLKEDINRIESSIKIIGDGKNLAVDINGRFNQEQAIDFLKSIEKYKLKWYEEPVDPLDYQATSKVSSASKTPLATGENIFSLIDSKNLVLYGGLIPERDYLQMDPVLSYGLVEYFRILKMLKNNNWRNDRCIPHGGHQFGLHVAAGLGLYGNESYPEVFFPFGKFAEGMNIENSLVNLIDAPGIGYEEVPEIYEIMKLLI
jgi:L-alanine-DL-glutamate epimerase-like enolase superfamily enzyme